MSEAAQASTPREVKSGQARVKLAVSGRVNRAVNMVDDGGKDWTGVDVSDAFKRLGKPLGLFL